MPETIYLIRNGDLYNIGRTSNLEQVKKKLAPGVIEAFLQTDDSKEILKYLHVNYSDKRLPQTNYFRLTKAQSAECRNKLKKGLHKNDFKPFFSGATLILAFLTAWLSLTLLIIKFGIDPIFHQFIFIYA